MEMTQHAAGRFCFPELTTSDIAGAKRFYAELLGWTTFDVPSAQGSYALARVDGRDVAGIHLSTRGEARWLQYVSVDSTDRAAARAAELGGIVRVAPFDVPGVGRMAMIEDPARAAFALWEPRGMIGSQLEDVPGAPCWYELLTHDLARASRFYSRLFGWTIVEKDLPTVGAYSVARLDDKSVAGLMSIREEWGEVAPVWNVYFAVADCDEAARKVEQLGGCVIVAPRTVPGSGRFAPFTDPAGAGFDVFEPLPRP